MKTYNNIDEIIFCNFDIVVDNTISKISFDELINPTLTINNSFANSCSKHEFGVATCVAIARYQYNKDERSWPVRAEAIKPMLRNINKTGHKAQFLKVLKAWCGISDYDEMLKSEYSFRVTCLTALYLLHHRLTRGEAPFRELVKYVSQDMVHDEGFMGYMSNDIFRFAHKLGIDDTYLKFYREAFAKAKATA
ncbi:hypothetical protein [Endozoicomonas sp. ONNA1]|uniref:hypothetical protein n=1 Tax=Endozoicomonas sp. ONNA1 TaxID=2828740 RepID=UPI0021485BDC|nr:hypothetical protein [Endozoicomonas sp. ONNA1]